MRYYSGIGSRETPVDVCSFFTTVAGYLYKIGWILRSGGAPGADTAFEAGVPDEAGKHIYLPWKGFNGNKSERYDISKDALREAEKFHPAWKKLSEGAKKLHARNVYQVLGKNLEEPVSFVICYTKDGKASGGTGQAIRIATYNEIPVLNVRNEEDKQRIINLMKVSSDFINVF